MLLGTEVLQAPTGESTGEDISIFLARNGFVGESIVDGPGLRCVVFVQGCPHACPGCHNPATHPFGEGQAAAPGALYARVKAAGLCGGVTFSGGEPFCQARGLVRLAAPLRAEGYELAAYTGYTFEQLLKGDAELRRLLCLLDVLVDGPYLQEQRNLTLRCRGSANQRVLDVQKSLKAGVAVWRNDARWVGDTPAG